MEYILGGLGALCCGATIGGIGYGVYRCCAKDDLDTEIKKNNLEMEKKKYYKVYAQNGGIEENMRVFNVRRINQQEIQFDITIPIDWNKLKNNKNIDNVSALKNIKEIAKQVECKDEIDSKNKLIAEEIRKKHPIYYYLSFTLNKDGKIMVRSNGIMDRNKKQEDVRMEEFVNILQTLKSCLWRSEQLLQKKFCDLVDVFGKNDETQLFNEICEQFYITSYKAREDGDIVKNNKKSELNLSGVDLYDTKSVKQPF